MVGHQRLFEGLKCHGEAGHGTDPWWFPPGRGQSFTIRWEDEDSWCRIQGLALERQVHERCRKMVGGPTPNIERVNHFQPLSNEH